MTSVDDLYRRLQAHIQKLDEEFVSRFVPAAPSDEYPQPNEYCYSIQAFCILAHAAFEDYVEQVALKVVDKAVEDWIYLRKPSDTVLAMICHAGQTPAVTDDEESTDLRVFDYLRPVVEQAKSVFSTQVNNNHGVSMKYLRRLLIPAGLDVSADPVFHDSLAHLARARGSYAHKNVATTVLSPEDAKEHVANCLLLCDSIRGAVASLYP